MKYDSLPVVYLHTHFTIVYPDSVFMMYVYQFSRYCSSLKIPHVPPICRWSPLCIFWKAHAKLRRQDERKIDEQKQQIAELKKELDELKSTPGALKHQNILLGTTLPENLTVRPWK